jgi:hypothetical protein
MANELASMMNLQASVQQATTAFETAKSKLYTADGQPIFAPAEQEKRMGAALQALQASTETAVSIAKNNAQWAIGRKEVLLNSDPAADLAPPDLAAASQRAMFVREDVANMTFPELAARIRATAANGDKPGVFLLARYGAQKVRDFESNWGGKQLDPEASRGMSEAVDELGKLGAFLQPKRAADLAALDEIITRAVELRSYAERTIQTADGRDRQQRAQFEAMIRSW